MKILIDMGHPAHVHFFKNFIWEMEKRGHVIRIMARDKDCTIKLLNAYGFKYKNSGRYTGILKKIYSIFSVDYKLFNFSREFRPDIFVSWGGINAAHVSKLIKRPSIAFTDNECAWEQQILFVPFTDIVCTSTTFKKDFGKKHIKYNSYEELAYLHPRYFKPNPSVLEELKINKNDFIILRLVSWDATHDINECGLNFKNESELIKFIKALEEYGKVFVTSEKKLSPALEPYKVPVSEEKMHDLLYFAQMYIGEGATMAAEAAMLGTPSIYVSSIQLGFINELRDKYGLVYTCWGCADALKIATSLLNNPKLKDEWQTKRRKLLEESIDVTEFMVKLIEDYPDSVEELKYAEKQP